MAVTGQAPIGQNYEKAVVGVASTEAVVTTVLMPLRMDSVTGRLLVSATTDATNTQYTEGDTDASITGTVVMWEDTGDTIRAASAAKPLPVNVISGASNTQYTEGDTDASITGTAMLFETNTGTSALGVVSATNPVPVSDNSTTLSIDDGAGSITVDGTIAATQSGTWNIGTVTTVTTVSSVTAIANALPAGTNNIGDVDVLSIAAGDNNIGNVDIVTVPAPLSTTGGGTEAAALRVTVASDSTGVLSVDDNGGSLTVDGAITAVGTVADDATTPGAPVMIGGTAKNFDGTTPGQISAEDDVTRVITDPNRRLYVNNVHPQFWSFHSDGSTALTDQEVKADPGDNFAIFITDIVFSNGSTSAMNLFFEEGASKILGPYYLEAINGRGLHIKFETPKMVTASTAVTCTTSAAAAHSVDVTGFVARVN